LACGLAHASGFFVFIHNGFTQEKNLAQEFLLQPVVRDGRACCVRRLCRTCQFESLELMLNIQPKKESGERYNGLDALRAFAMFLGIALHVSVGYMQNPPLAFPMNEDRNLTFDILNLGIHSFRMQLFFVVAGFFAHMVFHRSGSKEFFQQRLQRIGVPFLVGFGIVLPLMWLCFGYNSTGDWAGARFLFQQLAFKHLMHLWFLYYLMIYYFLVVFFYPMITRLMTEKIMAKGDSVFRFIMSSRFKPFYLAFPTLLIYSFTDSWGDIGLQTTLIPVPRVLIYYFCFFIFGWWMHRNVDCLQSLKNPYWLLGGSFLLLAGLVVLVPLEKDTAHPDYFLLKTTTFIVYNLMTWTSVFAFISLFLTWFKNPSYRVRYLADASYWCYLAHLPIVMVLQALVIELDYSAFGGFFLCTLFTVIILGLSYRYAVRYTFVGTLLNGPRKWPGDSAALQEKLVENPNRLAEKH